MCASRFARYGLAIVCVVAAVCASIAAKAMQPLSKPEAASMFASSRAQWEGLVDELVKYNGIKWELFDRDTMAQRYARFGTEENGFGLVSKTAEGLLFARPLYRQGVAHPYALQVTVGYRRQTAGSQLSDEEVDRLIGKAKERMLPEYRLTAMFERGNGELAIHYVIYPSIPRCVDC